MEEQQQSRGPAVSAAAADAGAEASALAAVGALRDRRTRLQDVVTERCEGEGCAGPCASVLRCEGYDSIGAVLEVVASVEGQLEAVLEQAARDRSAVARLSAAMHESAARHAATLGAVRDGVIEVDREGTVRLLTPAAAATLGVRREDVLGRRLRDLPALSALEAALAGHRHETGVVTLPSGDVLLRCQAFAEGVVAAVRDASAERAAARRPGGAPARYTFDDLVGADPEFVRVLDDAKRAARSDVAVLICGESGTGKELLAQAIHNASARPGEPFLGVNVTAIPHELLESELFGYEGGAFTGARPGGRPGKFELAGRGTLLLDEIGDMPLDMQSKLLRVLQERLVARLGSAREVGMRARVVATTHRDLSEAVRLGRFRLDLFHRLCVLDLRLPPLRERRADVPLLVEHHLRRHAERTGRRLRVAPPVMAALRAFHWPGNVRQLLNVLDGEISVLPDGADELTRVPAAVLPGWPGAGDATAAGGDEVLCLDELERRACEHALSVFDGNITRAARALGIAKGTLYAKMRRYGIRSLQAGAGEREAAPGAAGGVLARALADGARGRA